MATDSITNAEANGPKGDLGDYQHASRLFVDENFRLAPKSKFNFHVVFTFNKSILSSPFSDSNQNEINMLVKKIDLPKFEIQTTVANQYNRKKVIQTKIEFKPINISFHDDGAGVVRRFWENYYGYYFADYKAAKEDARYTRNATKGYSTIKSSYGLDNGSTIPFLDNVTIYHMAHGYTTSYKLINPIISAWNHDSLEYAIGNQLAEHTITLQYESVGYADPIKIAEDTPPGFASEHYDLAPSSFTLGNSSSGLLYDAINKNYT